MAEKLHNLATSLPLKMPAAWGFAFFAALAVALGQFVYQTSAPEIVRRYTLQEYQETKSHPTGRAPTSDEINSALHLIRRAELNDGTFLNQRITLCLAAIFKAIFEFESKLKNLYDWNSALVFTGAIPTPDEMKTAAQSEKVQAAVKVARRALTAQGTFYAREALDLVQDERLFSRLLELVRPIAMEIVVTEAGAETNYPIPDRFETSAYLAMHHLSPPFRIDGEAERIAYDRERVWIGARVEYLDQSRFQARVRCLVSMAFYGTACALIAWITFTQARSVAEAVGWLPP